MNNPSFLRLRLTLPFVFASLTASQAAHQDACVSDLEMVLNQGYMPVASDLPRLVMHSYPYSPHYPHLTSVKTKKVWSPTQRIGERQKVIELVKFFDTKIKTLAKSGDPSAILQRAYLLILSAWLDSRALSTMCNILSGRQTIIPCEPERLGHGSSWTPYRHYLVFKRKNNRFYLIAHANGRQSPFYLQGIYDVPTPDPRQILPSFPYEQHDFGYHRTQTTSQRTPMPRHACYTLLMHLCKTYGKCSLPMCIQNIIVHYIPLLETLRYAYTIQIKTLHGRTTSRRSERLPDVPYRYAPLGDNLLAVLQFHKEENTYRNAHARLQSSVHVWDLKQHCIIGSIKPPRNNPLFTTLASYPKANGTMVLVLGTLQGCLYTTSTASKSFWKPKLFPKRLQASITTLLANPDYIITESWDTKGRSVVCGWCISNKKQTTFAIPKGRSSAKAFAWVHGKTHQCIVSDGDFLFTVDFKMPKFVSCVPIYLGQPSPTRSLATRLTNLGGMVLARNEYHTKLITSPAHGTYGKLPQYLLNVSPLGNDHYLILQQDTLSPNTLHVCLNQRPSTSSHGKSQGQRMYTQLYVTALQKVCSKTSYQLKIPIQGLQDGSTVITTNDFVVVAGFFGFVVLKRLDCVK